MINVYLKAPPLNLFFVLYLQSMGKGICFLLRTENQRMPFVPPIKYSDKNSTGLISLKGIPSTKTI